MKKPVSKEDLRAELEDAMGRFLEGCGEIEQVPQGVSGRFEDNSFIGNEGYAVYVPSNRTRPTAVNNEFGDNRRDRRKKSYMMTSGLPSHASK